MAPYDGSHRIRALTRLGIIDFVPEGDVPLDLANLEAAYGSLPESDG